MPEIDDWRVVAFGNTITHEAQQRGSRFRPAVRSDPRKGERFTYERLEEGGGVTEVTARHMDTPIEDPSHRRRHLIPKDFVKAYMLDDEDLRKIMVDPLNEYSQSIGWSFGKAHDDAIIGAFFADMLMGKQAQTTVSFPAGQKVTTAGNITIAKWRDAREILEANEVEEDDGPNRWFTAFTASQRKSLLGTTEVTSADYNTIRALVNGQVNDFLGFSLIKSQRIVKTGNDRLVPVWSRAAMVMGLTQEPRSSIKRRADKNDNWQVLYKAGHGAARLDEVSVVQIVCDES